MVDAQKLLDYRGEEERYLKSLFGGFRQTMLRLKDDPLMRDGRLSEFPRIWMLALSKADLLPDWDVDKFRETLILKVNDDIEALRAAIGDLIESPDALSIGEDYMLLSSAKFVVASDAADPIEIDVTKRIGVDLILPVASLLPLQRRVRWSERMTIPSKVLDSMADGAETIAAGLSSGKYARVTQLVSMIPGPIGRSQRGASLLAQAVVIAGPALKDLNAQARTNGEYLKATLTQFKLDIEQGASEKVIRTPR